MSRTAVVVIDMINPYDHADADKLVDPVRAVLPQVGGLIERAVGADPPVIYVNDNVGSRAVQPRPARGNRGCPG